jgi:hypothetical protein
MHEIRALRYFWPKWGRRGSPGTVRLSSYHRRNEADTAERRTVKRRLAQVIGRSIFETSCRHQVLSFEHHRLVAGLPENEAHAYRRQSSSGRTPKSHSNRLIPVPGLQPR